MKYRNGLNLYWKAIIIVNTITLIMLFLGILWDSRTEMKFPVDYEVKNVELAEYSAVFTQGTIRRRYIYPLIVSRGLSIYHGSGGEMLSDIIMYMQAMK